MIFEGDMYFEEALPTIRSGLETLSNECMFEFEIVDMNEMIRGIESGDDSILSFLTESERTHYNSIKLEKNRFQWVAGRYAVKSALLKYMHIDRNIVNLNSIEVLKGRDSAPYIPRYPAINCSISHSFPFCIGMVSSKRIGIDIEKIFVPGDSLIRYFYSDKEKEVLMDYKDTGEYSKQSMVFWTRKEAVSKYLRKGMKMNFKELDTTKDRIFLYNGYINVFSLADNNFCLSLACEV